MFDKNYYEDDKNGKLERLMHRMLKPIFQISPHIAVHSSDLKQQCYWEFGEWPDPLQFNIILNSYRSLFMQSLGDKLRMEHNDYLREKGEIK